MDLKQLTQMYDFSGKSVVITGGAGILGGEIACALVGCGASVAIVDRDPSLADRLIQRLETSVGRAIIVYGDVLQPATMEQAVEQVLHDFGRIDCLVNGAGGNHPQATTSPERSFFDLDPAAVDSTFRLNFTGTFLACQVFARQMAVQQEGAILNIASMNSLRPLTRIPAYSAAKAAVVNLTQWLAVHLAQEYSPGLRVNAIAPGFFLTHQNRYLLIAKETGDYTPRGQSVIAHTPMGRFGAPEDLVGTVLWLVSPASAFVTGIVVPVDGGFSAYSGV